MKRKSERVPMPDEDWQASSDAAALVRAAEVVADPKRFAKAEAHVAKKQAGLEKLFAGLRRRA